MPAVDPPPGHNFEFPHLNLPHGPPGPPGSPGPTGATGAPGPTPDPEVLRSMAKEQTRFVVLDLLAGSDLEFLKPFVQSVVREELKGLHVRRPTESTDLPTDPWDGQTVTYSYTDPNVRINAKNDFLICLVGLDNQSGASEPNGFIRPNKETPLSFVRLMALYEKDRKVWISTGLLGSWSIDS